MITYAIEYKSLADLGDYLKNHNLAPSRFWRLGNDNVHPTDPGWWEDETLETLLLLTEETHDDGHTPEHHRPAA